MLHADLAAVAETLERGSTHALALGDGRLERARVLLSLALRAEMKAEEARIAHAICCGGNAHAGVPILAPVLGQWRALAPAAELEATVGKLATRRFAFDDSMQLAAASVQPASPAVAVDGSLPPCGEPFAGWKKPTAADVEALVNNSFFKKDSEAACNDATTGRGLLAPPAVGLSSCDLLAALVQLLLSDPFCPSGFTPEMLVVFLGCLRGGSGGATASGPAAARPPPSTSSAVDRPRSWAGARTPDQPPAVSSNTLG